MGKSIFRKKRLFIPLLTFLLVFLLGLGFLVWFKENSRPVSKSNEQIRFVVTRGKSAVGIAEDLYKKGLIKSPLAFKFYVQFTGKSEKISAGEFKLSPNMSLFDVISTLQGKPAELWITIPEGLRNEEMPDRFIEALEMEGNDAVIFNNMFLEETNGLEGYLFPDTYLFSRTASASAVIAKMNQTFETKTKDLKSGSALKNGYSFEEVVVMASIIERETKTDEERPIVAGILYKRLDNGWPLQVDAAVQYAVANTKCQIPNAKCSQWWPILTKDDLEINSPFNTYKFNGLPPTPISNPGISSLKAAANPESSAFWFYIHDTEGKIHYAETSEEHNQNINQYLKK